MAKGRKKRLFTVSRDSTPIATPRVTRPVYLPAVEDRRRFDPYPERPPRTVFGPAASITISTPVRSVTLHRRSVIARSYYTGAPRGLQVPVGLKFSKPLSVIACVRRKVRRAVLHARRKTGRGVKRRRPRRTWASNIRC